MSKKRNSNIELLRILSIIMVVLSHYSVHNGISNSELPLGINRLILEVSTLGNIGVIIFVLITGYYSINQKKTISIKKILLLYFELFFYSIVIYISLWKLGYYTFSVKELIKCFLPIGFKNYWFLSVYIIIYFFSPYINLFVQKMNRKEHLIFIIQSFIVLMLMTLSAQDYYINDLFLFLLYYIIGAYFGIYKNNCLKNTKNNRLLFIISSIFLSLSIIMLDLLGEIIPLFGQHSIYFLSKNSVISILLSVSIFNAFINKPIYTNKHINLISSCVLGVYLISDNKHFRNILWINIFKTYLFVNSKYLILHMLGSIIIIFISCILIEFIRKNTIEKMLKIIIDLCYNKAKNWKLYKKMLSCLQRILDGGQNG